MRVNRFLGAAAAAISVGMLSAAAPAQVSVVSDQVRAGELQVPLNKSQVLRVDREFSRALIGNPDVADVLPLTNRSLYVLGKKVGTTSLTIYDRRNSLIAVVDVAVGPDVLGLRRQLSELLPSDHIGARMSNDSIVLDGVVSSGPAADRAMQLAATYAPGKVVNMMSVGSSQQVMLEVRFSEMNRTTAKQIGINHTFLNSSGRFVGGIGNNGLQGVPTTGNSTTSDTLFGATGGTPASDLTRSLTSPRIVEGTGVASRLGSGALDTLIPTTGFGAVGILSSILGLRVSSVLDALETKGLVTTLAEPTLVALSGETASFLAGGEFPIPVAQSTAAGIGGTSSAITVEFKPFGVSLAFTPTVLADGVISLVVAPEVSSLDDGAAVVINGLRVPGLRTRRAKTVVELRDGESFAIAGLLGKDFSTTVRQIPLLGSIPIIGSLFRSSGFQRGDTELVMIVTPRLVRPVPAGSLKVPTDRATPPNEVDLFLHGRTDGAVNAYPLDPNVRMPVGRPIGEPDSIDKPKKPAAPAGERPELKASQKGGPIGGMSLSDPSILAKDYGHVL